MIEPWVWSTINGQEEEKELVKLHYYPTVT